MALFQPPGSLATTSGGANSFTVVEQPPDQGAVSGRPGVSSGASGDVLFTLRCDPRYWIPSETYFRIEGHFTIGDGSVALTWKGDTRIAANTDSTANSNIAYCQNWPSALFQTCRVLLNGTMLEQCQYVAQTDMVATISAATKGWLDSYGSAQGIGEPFMTRLANSAQYPSSAAAGAANFQEVVATWRPPLSILNYPYAIKGNQFRIIMSFAPQAEQQIIESIASRAPGTNYRFTIDKLSLMVATCTPDPSVAVPRRILIDLTPCATTLVALSATSGSSNNVSIPPTTFRLAYAFQDANSANSLAHGQNGLKPITDFALQFSNGATDNACGLTGFRWSSSQLGFSWPQPDYAFTNPGSRADYERAYRDFIQTTQGDNDLSEGAIPFGNMDQSRGINAFVSTAVGTAPILAVSFADPANMGAYNYQQLTAATLPSATYYSAMYGWLGRWPIICAPVVKPVGTNLAQIDVVTSFASLVGQASNTVTAVNMFVFAYYGAAAAIEYNADGSVSKVEVQVNN